MPKIRHLAIKTKHPAKLAEFYAEVFDMKVIHSEKSGAVYMSDGYLTLAILRNRGEAAPSGIHPDLVEGWVFCRRAFDLERAGFSGRCTV